MIQTDVLIIGAGPCGLFQVFELGLLDLRAHVVDSMKHVGGQCAELYPDKPIYDIPGFPVVGAQELIDNLMEQIKPFDPQFHLGHEVREVEPQEDGSFRVKTHRGTEFMARSIVIAGGVGSFQPRQLRLPGHEVLNGKQMHYKVKQPEIFADRRLAVLGGGDSALDWTLALQGKAKEMTLIHRRKEYRAQPHSVNTMQALCDAGEMKSILGSVVGLNLEDDVLKSIKIMDPERNVSELEVDDLLIFWGLAPKLGPIAEWGLNLNRTQIEVDTEKFETSTPGIYAVGDINTYPGKKKLILSGFHEAALAAFAIRHRLFPEERVRLQYTTTSTAVHEKLGV